MTQLLFCLICAAALVAFSGAASKDSRFLLFVGIVILSVTSGLRALDVGIDTAFYYDAFVSNFTARPWQFDEPGFRLFVNVLMSLFKRPEIVFLIIATITNSLIILRLWDFRKNGSFSYMAFFYVAVFYIGTMNTMRQYLSASIVFFATRFLEGKKYAPFVAALLIATTIHTTALIGIIYLLIYLWSSTPKQNRPYVFLLEVVMIPASLVVVLNYESGLMDNYLSNGISNVNITFIYRIGSFILAVFLLWLSRSKDSVHSDQASLSRTVGPVPLFAFVGLLASSAGMFFANLERIGYYFNIFESVFWGLEVRKKAWGWLYFLMPSIYALYVFVHELAFNGSGIFPFHFFFN